MRRLLVFWTIGLIVCCWSVSAMPVGAVDEPPSAVTVEKGFVSIFNGKDLTGWEGDPGWWRVEDGAITGELTKEKTRDTCTYLFWRGGKPADFELRASFKLSGEKANSGIQFRTRELKNFDADGYQADMEAGRIFTGTLYDCNGRGTIAERGEKVSIDENGKRTVKTFATAAELQKLYKPNDWNQYRIIARGHKITLFVNGALMCETIDHQKGRAALDGLIGLQLHASHPMKAQFKNLRIKTIPKRDK